MEESKIRSNKQGVDILHGGDILYENRSATEGNIIMNESGKGKDDDVFVLRKSIGFRQAFAYVVGILIGAGIFVSPSLIAKETTNLGFALLVWVMAAILCLFAALCYCELATMLKKNGGEYIYIKEAYGNPLAFLAVWAQALIIFPSSLTIVATTLGEYFTEPFYDTSSLTGIWITKSVAVLSMLIATFVNCISNSCVAKTQLFFTITQTSAIFFIVAVGVWKVSTGHLTNYETMFDNSTNFDVGSFGLALYDGLWGYQGWAYIPTMCEEMKNMKKDIWLSTITGIPFVALCYLLINLAFMSALTRDEIANSSTVATSFIRKAFGDKAALAAPIFVALSCYCCLNGATLIYSRAILSAAREGQFPEPLSYIHRNKRTPNISTWFVFFVTVLWVLPSSELQSIVTSFSFAVWFTYSLAIFAVVILRIKKPDAPRPFKVWIINPIFTSIIAVFLVAAPFIKSPVNSTICLASILASLPVYYFLILKHDKLPLQFRSWKKKLYQIILDKFNMVPCTYVDDKEDTGGL